MALIEKLKAIADAIRSKTNKSEELTLEQMASEVNDINTLQGLDFSEIYDQEQANEINQYYKGGIEYAKQIKEDIETNIKNDWRLRFRQNEKIIIFPKVDFLEITSLEETWFYASKIIYFPNRVYAANCKSFYRTWMYCFNLEGSMEIDASSATDMYQIFHSCYNIIEITVNNTNNVENLYQAFMYCYLLENIVLGSIKKCSIFDYCFNGCSSLTNCKFSEWKEGNISLSTSRLLTPESIKYIIWHALNGENNLGFENQGATSRILTLHATPYNSWETWKLTKPSVEDCEYLGVSEDEITKYGELTWEDIALDIKLITIAK